MVAESVTASHWYTCSQDWKFRIVTDFVTKFASTGNIDMDSRTVLVYPDSGIYYHTNISKRHIIYEAFPDT